MNEAHAAKEPSAAPISEVNRLEPGNRPVDGGAYTFSAEEKADFLGEEPGAEKWFRPWIGGPELLRGKPRYFLYLKDAAPEDLAQLPMTHERVRQVEEFRKSSQFPEVMKMAEHPTQLAAENVPESGFLVIPTITSERRSYIPMGLLEGGTLAGTTLYVLPEGGLYELGILESKMHMAWMRAMAEKVRQDYHYDPQKVYNTFAWPEITPEQKKRIEETAKGILDARALFPDKSLAVLYDDQHMPEELKQAHEANDRAVMEAYGMDPDRASEEDIIDLLRIRARDKA